MKSRVLWILFILLLVIPRVLRFIWADVQIEDPNYIYGAFLILKGLIPFAEFAQVNPPLLEIFIATLYKIFGVSYRIPEIVSGVAYLLSAFLIFRIGKRTGTRSIGIIASLLYSWHFLLFRYHLFEREIFATLAVLLAMEFLTREDSGSWTSLIAGLIMGMGFACKQTALIPFVTILVFIFLFRRQWRSAVFLGAGFFFITGLITAGYSLVFGSQYMAQTFWFHWIKGFVAPWYIKASWTVAGIGFLIPLSLAGLIYFKSILKDWNWLWLALVAGDLVFFWFISGAFWPHYLLSTLPFAALIAAAFLDSIGKEIWMASKTNLAEHNSLAKNVKLPVSLIICAVLIAIMQIYFPGAMIGEGAADNFGFSGIPRAEVASAAKAIRDNTSETDKIIADPFIALEAQRIKVVRFKDNWGLILWMNRMIQRGEYNSFCRQRGWCCSAKL